MRVISRKTLVEFFTKHAIYKGSIEAFFKELKAADWQKPSDIIEAYSSADVITGERFVFNIKGNSARLVADVDFTHKLVFIIWIGTHAEYDRIDVKTVKYVKSNKD